MKKSLIMLGMLGVAFTYAQDTTGKVGINTDTPYATLDVVAKNADGTSIEGFRTPQLTGDALQKMTANLTENNDGLVVYVTSAVTTPDDATKKVTFPGYYRFTFKTNEGGLDYTKTGEQTTNALKGSFLYAEKSWVRLEPTGLEVVSNPNDTSKVGRRLVGANPKNYGDIGLLAVDMSHQTGGVTEKVDGKDVTIGGATGDYSFATGIDNIAKATNSAVFGNKNNAESDRSVLFGQGGKITYQTIKQGEKYIASSKIVEATADIEKTSDASRNSVAMGVNSTIINSPNSLAYGANTTITNSQNGFAGGGGGTKIKDGDSAVALGNAVFVRGNGSIGLGSKIQVNGINSVALGVSSKVGTYDTDTLVNYAVAIGNNANVTAVNGVAIGANTTVSGSNGVAIGNGAKAQSSNDVAIGSSATNVVLGKLKTESTGTTTCEKGRIIFDGTDFYGCTGTWKKLNND